MRRRLNTPFWPRASANSPDRDLGHRVPPVAPRGVEVADAVDACVYVNVPLSPTRFAPASGSAALGKERTWDRRAQLVVALAPRVVRRRIECRRLVAARPLDTV